MSNFVCKIRIFCASLPFFYPIRNKIELYRAKYPKGILEDFFSNFYKVYRL